MTLAHFPFFSSHFCIYFMTQFLSFIYCILASKEPCMIVVLTCNKFWSFCSKINETLSVARNSWFLINNSVIYTIGNQCWLLTKITMMIGVQNIFCYWWVNEVIIEASMYFFNKKKAYYFACIKVYQQLI